MNAALFSILLTVFFLAFGMSFVSPLVPLLLKSIGASTASIGQIQTTYFLSFTITTLLLGRWIDRIGSKKIILAGLTIFSLAIFLMPYMPGPKLFYLIRIIQGIGSAFIFAPTEAAINIISPPEKRGANLGLYGLVFAVGFAFGPVVGTSLYAVNTAGPFILGAVCCFIASVVLFIGFAETKVPVKKTEFGFLNLLGILLIPLTAALCYAFVEVSIASFLSLYLDNMSISGKYLGIVFTFFAIGGAVSPYPAGLVADRWGKRPVLSCCGAVLVLSTLSFNFFQNYWIICLLTCCIGLIAGALYPVALSLIGELVPAHKIGVANASFTFFYGLGSVIGPLITGWVLEVSSIQYLFYPMTVSASLFFLVTIFSWLLQSKNQ